MSGLAWVFDDGGRSAAGFKGTTGDCVTRSIAIATGLPYLEVYNALNEGAQRERPRPGRRRSSARTGVARSTSRRYLEALGWVWTPTMTIGSGCRVHLRADELPKGRLVVSVSKHFVAVIDGVIRDAFDPSRDGTRCVYGYWRPGPGWKAPSPPSSPLELPEGPPAELLKRLAAQAWPNLPLAQRAALEAAIDAAAKPAPAKQPRVFRRAATERELEATARLRRAKAAFVSRCIELDIEVLDDDLELDAPLGKVFGGTATHFIRLGFEGASPSERARTYEAGLDDLSYGLEGCDDEECERCAKH